MSMQQTLAGPPRVQIQTQGGCNGRCVFCPNEEVLRAKLPQGRMDPALYRKIIDELAQTDPRRVSLYLMNEPLLDKRLPEFARYATERLPKTATTLVTSNGSNLTEEMAASLIDSGLQRLKVSLQSLDPETNRRLMGRRMDSAKVVRNVLAMRRLIDERKARHFDLRVSMVVTSWNEAEIESARRFWKGHGVRLVTSALENRGGNIRETDALNAHGMKSRSHGCIRPSREMCVLWNGDVVLCCVDWHRTEVVGNLADQSVLEVWNGPRLKEIRRAVDENDAAAMPDICAHCTESAAPDHHRRGLRGWLSRRRSQWAT
jgi:pyruvate-formate lyase-activating enzyme